MTSIEGAARPRRIERDIPIRCASLLALAALGCSFGSAGRSQLDAAGAAGGNDTQEPAPSPCPGADTRPCLEGPPPCFGSVFPDGGCFAFLGNVCNTDDVGYVCDRGIWRCPSLTLPATSCPCFGTDGVASSCPGGVDGGGDAGDGGDAADGG